MEFSIWDRAMMGEKEIALLPESSTLFDERSRTPLHYLALFAARSCLETAILVASHPDAALVVDHWGKTPLHYLAASLNPWVVREVHSHPLRFACGDPLGESVPEEWGQYVDRTGIILMLRGYTPEEIKKYGPKFEGRERANFAERLERWKHLSERRFG